MSNAVEEKFKQFGNLFIKNLGNQITNNLVINDDAEGRSLTDRGENIEMASSQDESGEENEVPE